MRFLALIPVILIAALLSFKSMFIIVDVTEQVIITQLGKPVKTFTEPGLYFKMPFAQNAVYLTKKLIEYDAQPSEILTKDKKNLVIDNYCRWKISDPLKFYLTVRDTNSAMNRLDDIIYSEIRNELGKNSLHEVITDNRNAIMDSVTVLSRKKAEEYGIYIADIRIKRADLPEQNEKAVYARMQAERQRIAKQYRSEGLEEAQKIKARTDKEKTIILAEAYKTEQEIMGRTDAKVIKIYADAFNQDPAFYEFYKSLEVYRKVLKDQTQFYLTTDSEILKVLKQGN